MSSLLFLAARRFSTAASSSKKVAFIGAGKMAEAMISPLRQTTLLPSPPTITFFEISPTIRDKVKEKFPSISAAGSIAEAVQGSDLVVLSVKPQNAAKVLESLRPALQGSSTKPAILSIMAGVPIPVMASGVGDPNYPVYRSMPNTPAMIEQGVTVWTSNPNALVCEKDMALVRAALTAMGTEIFVDDEKFIDMATSISGSGPAYVFILIEAMVDAGVHMGFPRDIATKLVHQTLLGTTMYAMETKEHPAILKNSVTSPAGTTASAMYELENGRFRTVIQNAIWACYRRSLELGGKNSNVGPGRSMNANLFNQQQIQQLQQMIVPQSAAEEQQQQRLPASEFPDFKNKKAR